MSTQFSDVGHGDAAEDAAGAAPAEPGGEHAPSPGDDATQAPVAPRRSFWVRPWGIASIVGLALALSMALIVGMVTIGAVTAPKPQKLVMLDEFYHVRDSPMQVLDGLSWNVSGATLNVYPTEKGPQLLYFALPESSAAMKVEATVAEPAYADEASLVWGIAAYNGSTERGVALLCSAGGTLFLADAVSAEPLSVGRSDIPCQQKMSLSLEVSGRSVQYGTASAAPTLYFGDVVYGGLDTVAVVIAAEKPDQVVRVTRIAVFQ